MVLRNKPTPEQEEALAEWLRSVGASDVRQVVRVTDVDVEWDAKKIRRVVVTAWVEVE